MHSVGPHTPRNNGANGKWHTTGSLGSQGRTAAHTYTNPLATAAVLDCVPFIEELSCTSNVGRCRVYIRSTTNQSLPVKRSSRNGGASGRPVPVFVIRRRTSLNGLPGVRGLCRFNLFLLYMSWTTAQRRDLFDNCIMPCVSLELSGQSAQSHKFIPPLLTTTNHQVVDARATHEPCLDVRRLRVPDEIIPPETSISGSDRIGSYAITARVESSRVAGAGDVLSMIRRQLSAGTPRLPVERIIYASAMQY